MYMYTDGSCLGNPGKGGWAVISKNPDFQLSGHEPYTTNNIMELTAVLKGLEKCIELGHDSGIKIYTDSVYVKNGITKWVHTWILNGWMTSNGQEVKNRTLWQSLYNITKILQHVEWFWVKAHNGHLINEQVDKLARNAANNI